MEGEYILFCLELDQELFTILGNPVTDSIAASSLTVVPAKV